MEAESVYAIGMDCDPPAAGGRKACSVDRWVLTAALAWGLLASAWARAEPPASGQPSAGASRPPTDKVVLPESVKGKWTAAKIIVEDKSTKTKQEYAVKLNSDFAVPNSSLKIHVGEFLPDFRMDGMNLTSGSNEPKNPALGIRISENNKQIFPPPGKQWGWLFAKVPSIHPFEHPKYGIILKEGVKKG